VTMVEPSEMVEVWMMKGWVSPSERSRENKRVVSEEEGKENDATHISQHSPVVNPKTPPLTRPNSTPFLHTPNLPNQVG